MLPTDAPDIVVERVIKATPERIFKALTDASEIEKWFFSTVETDPRPGGSYRMVWESKKDAAHNHTRWGSYREFVPNQRLVFEWRGIGIENKAGHEIDPTDEHLTLVSITLTPVAGGTKVTLVHSGWGTSEPWKKSRDGHTEGWTFYLENLDSVLLTGKDLRLEQSNQRVKTG